MTTNNKKNIIIIGASGHAKVIIDIIEQINKFNIVGLIDSFKPIDFKIFKYKVIGREEDIPKLALKYNFNKGIIAIGDNWTRKKMYHKIKNIYPEFDYISAIHPKAIIGKHVTIGKGTVIMAGVIVNSDSKIGRFCILNTKASLGHDGNLKKFASLAPNSTVGGNVKIGTCTAICIGTNILQNIIIGKYTIIGAASLVNRNIPDYKMAYGSPAKAIKSIDKGERYLYIIDNKKTKLEIITQKKEWDKTLNETDLYDYYHTYDYHALSKKNNETPILLKYTEKKIIIAIPLLSRQVFDTNYNDCTSVYGYAGPISKGVDDTFDNTQFKKKLSKYFYDNNIISIFSRLNPYIPFQDQILKNIGKTVTQGNVVNIDLTIDIDIQRQIYRSRLKTHINKARRNCSIREVSTKEDLDTFISLYHENMDRVNAKESYYFNKTYFENLLKSKSFKTIILLAIENTTNKIIAGSIFILTNGIVQYHLSGSKASFLHLTPTKLLIDEMRIIANKEGFKFFNLGGGLGGRDDDSLFYFKSSFSKDFNSFNLWEFIVDSKIYDKITKQNKPTIDSDYFPAYRYNQTVN